MLYSLILNSQNAERANLRALDFLKHEDPYSALPFLNQAANLGNAESQYNLAYLYQKGLAVEQNDSIAHLWYLKSAEQGFISAQFKVAYNYSSGRGVEKDPEEAFYWSRECALLKDPECISHVVACFNEGFGVEPNADSAKAWTVRAAILPDLENLRLSSFISSARLGLAQDYMNDKNYEEAFVWYLIYNESKRDFSMLVQQQIIEEILGLELHLDSSQKDKLIQKAEGKIGRKLKNLDQLYKVDL